MRAETTGSPVDPHSGPGCGPLWPGALLAGFVWLLFPASLPLMLPDLVGLDAPLPLAGSLLTQLPGLLSAPLGAWFAGRLIQMRSLEQVRVWSLALLILSSLMLAALPALTSLGSIALLVPASLRLLQTMAVGAQLALLLAAVSTQVWTGQPWRVGRWLALIAAGQALAATSAWLLLTDPFGLASLPLAGWRLPLLLSLLASPWLLSRAAHRRRESASREVEHPRPSWRWLFAAGLLPGALAPLISMLGGNELGSRQALPPADVWPLLALTYACAIPLYLLAAALTRVLGARRHLLVALVLAAAAVLPVMGGLKAAANPALAAFQDRVAITLTAPACPTFSDCAMLRDHLLAQGLAVRMQHGPEVSLQLGPFTLNELTVFSVQSALDASGLPERAYPDRHGMMLWLVLLALLATTISVPTLTLGARLLGRDGSGAMGASWLLGLASLPLLPALIAVPSVRFSGEPVAAFAGWCLLALLAALAAWRWLPADRQG